MAVAVALLLMPVMLTVRFLYLGLYRNVVVQNAGPRPIHVLAVGTTSSQILPLWSPSSPEAQAVIGPGAQTSFRYNFDGVNLCWLLVFADGEEPRVLKTPLGEAQCALAPESGKWPCCWPIEDGTVLVVPSLEELERAPKALVAPTSAR